jgi:hypothetical protein
MISLIYKVFPLSRFKQESKNYSTFRVKRKNLTEKFSALRRTPPPEADNQLFDHKLCRNY